MALKRVAKKKQVPQPPPIPNGDGAKFMRMTDPHRDVMLDAGVFDYLWRVVESRYREAQSKAGSSPAWDAQRDMLERAVEAFRLVAEPKVPEVAPGRPRRVIKRH